MFKIKLTFFLTLFISFQYNQAIKTFDLDDSVKVELSKEKIRVRLDNGQTLIGNRKLVSFKKNFTIKTKIIYEFLGLPFAQAPIREKRFKFPIRLNRIFDTYDYDATYARPSCMQEYDTTFPGFSGSEMWNPPNNISEDCLYFNIWVPVSENQDQILFKKESLNQRNYNSSIFRVKSEKTTLFWIYGGSFSSGSSNLRISEGTLLSSYENVITVTANYRVGPFGFFFLNNDQSPGNAGLADQLMAIEWYKENYMSFFGGSSEKLCLFGESAGSMSLHYLLISSKSHLFNRAIFQSTSAYLDLSFRTPNEAYRVSLSYAEKVGCLKINKKTNSTQKYNPLQLRPDNNENKVTDDDLKNLNGLILNCLLNLNASYLSQKQFEIEYVNEHLKMQFVPTLDFNKLIQTSPFDFDFNANQNKYLNHEILVGINQDEATYFNFYLYNNVYFNLENLNLNTKIKYNNEFVLNRLRESFLTKQVPAKEKIISIKFENSKIPIINLTLTDDDRTNNVDKFFYEKYINCVSSVYTEKNFIFEDTDGNELNFNLDQNFKNSPYLAWKKLNKIIADYIYVCPSIKLANKFSQLGSNKTYFYKFNKRNWANPWPEWMGVLHGYEIEYIFGIPWIDKNLYNQEDRLISRRMMNYWANFAKYGRLSSNFDTKNPRDHFVELAPLSKYKNLTESQEYDLFNKLFINCELFNELSSKDSYAKKYEQCLKFHDSALSAAFNLNSSFKLSKHSFITYYSNFFSYILISVSIYFNFIF